jgi:sugar phosphate isomerase/epimerase
MTLKPTTRRKFLKHGGMAVAAAASLPYLAWADPLGLPIGIQLYTVGSDLQKDAAATIKQIATIGYKEVETAGFGSAKTAVELRKILDDNGLKCPSAHLSFDLKNLQKTFDDANALGCQYATSSVPRSMLNAPAAPGATMTPEERAEARKRMMGPMTADDFKRLADAENAVGAAAKKSGLTFAAHNHTMEFVLVDGKPGYDYLLNHTDPELVKFEIDCGWMSVAGYKPGDYMAKYPGRVKMLHIKDFLPFEKSANAGPGTVLGSEIGSGVVDYKAIFKDVKGKGIQHIFVEQEAPYTRMPPMQAAEVDYKYLHSLS